MHAFERTLRARFTLGMAETLQLVLRIVEANISTICPSWQLSNYLKYQILIRRETEHVYEIEEATISFKINCKASSS